MKYVAHYKYKKMYDELEASEVSKRKGLGISISKVELEKLEQYGAHGYNRAEINKRRNEI
ncbi:MULTISPECIES: hypothetical protein [Bacillus]|uniref:hypothetical protein n=1 Tax=Bacillus TaxID=1386 RepID=UPI001C6363E7|nr:MULTISPECIES: hypothetical protein [Bacillus]QWU44578.1 hypothetical protein KPL75_22790 [Bacillus sp. NP247]UYX54159.1 hypothetical protein M3Y14_08530 [Bacillus thuringiensis]